MKSDPKTTAARAFVRSLNILLKFARLYGYEHTRTMEQLEIAWERVAHGGAGKCGQWFAAGRDGSTVATGWCATRRSASGKTICAIAECCGTGEHPVPTKRDAGRARETDPRIPRGQSEAGRTGAAIEGSDRRRPGHPRERSLFRGHGCALERCQRCGAACGGFIRRGSRRV